MLLCYAFDLVIQDCGQLQTFFDLYQLSVTDPEYFFGKVGKSLLDWKKPFKRAYSCCTSKRRIEWFSGGKLNISGMLNLTWQECKLSLGTNVWHA